MKNAILTSAFLVSLFSSSLRADIVPPRPEDQLRASLALHASFDKGFDADFSRGDKACYLKTSAGLVPCVESEELKLVPEGGRHGGAIHFL